MSSRIPPVTAAAERKRMPVAVAHQREAAREHALIRKGVEQLFGAAHAIPAPLTDSSAGEFAALCRARRRFRCSAPAAASAAAATARGDARECVRCSCALACKARGNRFARVSSRWRGSASNSSRAGSARVAARSSVRRMLHAALPRADLARSQRRDRRQQLGAHRHRDFGGGGRRRRAPVGRKIDQRDVGLVADRGNERDHALGRRPHHDLLVERPQVLERAAAARDDDQVRAAAARRARAAR